jgi:hypothetical protein
MDIIKYLSELPRVTRGKLLLQPHCCIAVYRGLSDKERLIVLRLLASPCPIDAIYENYFDRQLTVKSETTDTIDVDAAQDADKWTGISSKSDSEFPTSSSKKPAEPGRDLLPAFWNLGILDLIDGLLTLDEEFADLLYSSLSGPNEALIEMVFDNEIEEDLSIHGLVEFAKSKWEQLITPLLKLAHPNMSFPGRSRSLNEQLFRILNQAGLVDDYGKDLLAEGYTFLLSEIPKQIWLLANSYLSKELSPQHRADGISFLIFIATSLHPGKIYSRESLTEIQSELLEEWEQFGLIRFVNSMNNGKKKKSKDLYFTVTPLAGAIVETSGIGIHIGEWSSGIIVESNFYVYFYTNSSIMIALLELFAHVTVRLPNMCVARLTRQSVRAAFKKGIHSSHIIEYLRANKHAAHTALQTATQTSNVSNSRNSALSLAQALSSGNDSYDMEAMFPTSKSSGLPEQVEDQLKLWEEERFRFTATPIVHWQFETGVDDPNWYQATKEYAKDMGALVWSNDKEFSLAIKSSSQEPIVAFFKSIKTSSQ